MSFFPHLFSPVIRVIAIDPGSHHTGIARFDVKPAQKEIVSIRAWTVHVDKLKNDTGLLEELCSDKFIRFYKLRNEILRIFVRENPLYVAYEGPFMNRLQPSAYGPLVALQTLIQDALISYNAGTPFFVLQPQQGKKAVGVAGKKGKDVMREAIKNYPELMQGLTQGHCLLDELDEHAIDAIAVGFCALKIDLFPKE